MQVASLLRALLLETHDQPEWFEALLPVIIDCCSILAVLASASPDTFAAAVELLKTLAKQLASSGAAIFQALAVDDRVAVKAQALFCLLAATSTATQTSCASRTGDELAERFSATMQQSSMAPAAAKAVGEGFATAANSFSSRQLGSLVCRALQETAPGRAGGAKCRRLSVPVLPSRYHDLVLVPHNIRVSALLEHVVLLARVRLDLAPDSSVFLSLSQCVRTQPFGPPDDVRAHIRLEHWTDDTTVSCTVIHKKAHMSPRPALCLLPVRPGPCGAEAVLSTLLCEPPPRWEGVVRDILGDHAQIAAPSSFCLKRAFDDAVASSQSTSFKVQVSSSCRDLDHIVVLGVPLCP